MTPAPTHSTIQASNPAWVKIAWQVTICPQPSSGMIGTGNLISPLRPPKKPTCADTVLEVKARPKRVKVSKNKRKKLIELTTVLVSSQLKSHFHGTNSTPICNKAPPIF